MRNWRKIQRSSFDEKSPFTLVCLPLWKIWVRQSGLLFPIYGKIKNVPNHQPAWIKHHLPLFNNLQNSWNPPLSLGTSTMELHAPKKWKLPTGKSSSNENFAKSFSGSGAVHPSCKAVHTGWCPPVMWTLVYKPHEYYSYIMLYQLCLLVYKPHEYPWRL